MKDFNAVLEDIVNGDLSQFDIVLSVDQSALLNSAADLPQLIVSRSALISVLVGWRSGIYTPKVVQTWASFIRRGYVSQKSDSVVHPIAITYNASDEDLIVKIVGRLDEIGDKIDGDIDENEREEILKALNA